MKIKIINPDYGITREQMDKRVSILKNVTKENTFLSMDCLRETNVTIDSMLDIALASPEIVDMAIEAENEGYDAVILYCFSDPAIVACREAINIPVVGAGQSAVLTACGLGYNFSLITTDKARFPEKKAFINSLGIPLERLASVKSVDIPYDIPEDNKGRVLSHLSKVIEECVEEDNAEVIILGCLSFLGLTDELSKNIHVPILDPALNAVCTAELYVSQNLTHSKITYPSKKLNKKL